MEPRPPPLVEAGALVARPPAEEQKLVEVEALARPLPVAVEHRLPVLGPKQAKARQALPVVQHLAVVALGNQALHRTIRQQLGAAPPQVGLALLKAQLEPGRVAQLQREVAQAVPLPRRGAHSMRPTPRQPHKERQKI